jgi:hypothetical protein
MLVKLGEPEVANVLEVLIGHTLSRVRKIKPAKIEEATISVSFR